MGVWVWGGDTCDCGALLQRMEIEEKAKVEEHFRSKLGPGSGVRGDKGGGGEGEEEGTQSESSTKAKVKPPSAVTRRAPFRLTSYKPRKKEEQEKQPLEPVRGERERERERETILPHLLLSLSPLSRWVGLWSLCLSLS